MCKAEEELGNAFALVCELVLLMLTPVRHISFITLYSHVMQTVTTCTYNNSREQDSLTSSLGSLQELGEKFSINNDPILHFDFFCAYQAGTLHFEKRERLIGSEKVKM